MATPLKARRLTADRISGSRLPLPKGWKEAAGLLRNRHDLQPLACQRDLRKQWNTRLKRLGLSSR